MKDLVNRNPTRYLGIQVDSEFFKTIKLATINMDMTLHDTIVFALGMYLGLPEETQFKEIQRAKVVKLDEGLPIRESVGSNEAKSL